MDMSLTADIVAVGVAAFALGYSVWQGRERRKEDLVRALLGEKETIAYQAMKIAASSKRVEPSESVVRALVGAAIFDKSDRARLAVFRALDRLTDTSRFQACAALSEYAAARQEYGGALDVERFDKRVGQLTEALPWIETTGNVGADEA